MRAVEKNNVKFSKADDSNVRRRKISVGPIDFEQRREHIRLAYSKSIRESQALEARQKAAESRRKEIEEAANAKLAAEAIANSASASPALSDITNHANLDPQSNVQLFELSLQEHRTSIGLGIDPYQSDALDTPVDLNTPVDLDAPVDLVALQSTSPIELNIDPPSDQDFEIMITGSPDLGLPGAFPTQSPPVGGIRPLSAISATSDSTEFDIEPQTGPAVPGSHSPLQQIDGPEHSPTVGLWDFPHTRAVYQDPFELQPTPLVQPRASQETLQAIDVGLSPTDLDLPGAFRDDYDEPEILLGFNEAFSTEPDLPAFSIDEVPQQSINQSVPFPRLLIVDDSDCQSGDDEEHDDGTCDHAMGTSECTDNALSDICTEELGDRAESEDCESIQHSEVESISQHPSSCESSSSDIRYEPLHEHNQEQSYESSAHLAPNSASTFRAFRSSQQSNWTDEFVDSGDNSELASSPLLNGDVPQSFGHVTIFAPEKESPDNIPSFNEVQYNEAAVRPSIDSTTSGPHLRDYPFPEFTDFDQEYSIPRLSHDSHSNLSFLPSPTHQPPPVPFISSQLAPDSSRASSTLYDQSQPGGTLYSSTQASDAATQPSETPDSTEVASLDLAAIQLLDEGRISVDHGQQLIQDADEALIKEKKRLTQRRNVIKELVDTEAVFVRDMNIVEEIYKGTAEACPKLDAKTVKLIFRNTEEIIDFHTSFLGQVKEAAASVYIPKSGNSRISKEDSSTSQTDALSLKEVSNTDDRASVLGPIFASNLESMKMAHESFLRNSDQAAKKLIQIQQDPTVKVWLNECNEVAKDLTAAWDLDSLLIKPMQRITKYPNLIITLLQHTPADHPDRKHLLSAKDALETAIIEINQTKKNFELVGQIVGRKRKDSDVKAGFARAFGKRVDKLQTPANRPPEDPMYEKLNERFGDDYLRLQVVLRDVEFYTRQVSSYVHEFLQYLSSIELVMRLHPGNYPELESKWVQFNISVRDLEKIALEDHVSSHSAPRTSCICVTKESI